MVDSDFFGFLNRNLTLEFDGGIISPVEHFNEYADYVEKYTNQDGFCYPPLEHTVRVNPATEEAIEEVPKTERPALLHRLPPPHEIRLFEPLESITKLRKGPGSLVIHLLAYLYGTRLQFYDWWFDGRIPITENAKTHNIAIRETTTRHFLSHSFKTWQNWDDKCKKLFINIIYTHSRVPSYEWPFERFIIEYMVFDGCYSLAKKIFNVNASTHKGRFKALCERFEIPFEERKETVDEIYKLRHQLFHYTLWDNSMPCSGGSESAFMAPYHLRRFNQRLIPALLEYKTPYIRTGWWYLGSWVFDQP
ncbi:MAG: hypothetical protein PHX53_15500 [Syntrophales bacterium]|nr:hypothetical protein [Syntrophales bacterium]